MILSISRTNGPCNDRTIACEFQPEELETIKQVLAIVNAVSNDKEDWFCQFNDGTSIIPSVKVQEAQK